MLQQAALCYAKAGYSVIPVKSDDSKKAYIKWKSYQAKKADENEIKAWWSKWPDANIGIVTGVISGLTVIDIDSDEGREAIEAITPDSFLTPTATTPGGGEHRYCRFEEKVGNAVRFLPGCDVRSEGGYIIAPPSSNGRGEYKWVDGLHIAKVKVGVLPTSYLNAILSLNILSLDVGIRKEYNTSIYRGPSQNQQDQQTPTNANTLFAKGSRDKTLFRLANYLVKSGMPLQEIQQYLTFIASHCNPPFSEKEIPVKIQSALQRFNQQEKGLTEAVRDLIRQHEGNITTTQLLQWTTNANNPLERKKIHVVAGRMVKEGLLAKTGRVAGEYHIIKTEIEEIDWKNATTEMVELVLPLGIHKCVKFMPSSIILISGVTNSGKTAFAMSIANLNWGRMETRYLTSEIGGYEFKSRVQAHSGISGWDGVRMFGGFKSNDLPDLIQPNALNIIDYLEPPGGDYTQVATVMTDIQKALKSGIAIICLQKKEGDEYGAGGQFIKNVPHLFCTLDIVDYPVCKLTIRKAKATNDGYRNPGGESVEYKVARNGVDIVPYGKLNFTKWDEGDE